MRVNDELVLDAGVCEEASGPDGREFVIRPPETTLFHQVLAYLKAKPDPPKRPSGSMAGREGVAAAALTLRWGSYLAVLADPDNPLWPETGSRGTSRISDEEMARINIEASAALEEWIDLYRVDPGGRLYTKLVDRAVAYLPMPKGRPKLKAGTVAALADPGIASRLAQAADAERLSRARAEAERYPTRLLANALVNVAWRNGPVEDIHAGRFRGYPLGERRVTPAEERALMGFASAGMALGMTVCLSFAMHDQVPKKCIPCSGAGIDVRWCRLYGISGTLEISETAGSLGLWNCLLCGAAALPPGLDLDVPALVHHFLLVKRGSETSAWRGSAIRGR